MYVPPYVPQPTEIPGNVTTESYLVRLSFIRRVAFLHFLSALLVTGLIWLKWALPLFDVSLLGLSTVLIASSLIRTFARGASWEPWVSLALLPCILACLAGVLTGLSNLGWPIWSPALGLVAALMYAFACGRDLSFIGMFGLALITSSLAIVGIGLYERMVWFTVVLGLLMNGGYLLFYVYDLGSLLSRRRLGEEAGAVVDLYRDALNLVGYAIRSIRHWRDHRVWSK